MSKFTKYTKTSDYSYTLGAFPTIELLNKKSESLIKIVVSPKIGNRNLLQEILDLKDDAWIEESDRQIELLTKKGNVFVIGIFNKFESKIQENENHLLLVNPSNNGNLGTIIRTMNAFNMQNLAMIKPASDIFDPEVIRSSMGSVFNINFEYFETLEDYVAKFQNKLYFFDKSATHEISQIKLDKPYALVFGNEAKGLDPKYFEKGTIVKIPQSENVDSLNLAVSVGIGLYETSK